MWLFYSADMLFCWRSGHSLSLMLEMVTLIIITMFHYDIWTMYIHWFKYIRWTYPIVRPHVLLSNPKEILQWSLPTWAETHNSDTKSHKPDFAKPPWTYVRCKLLGLLFLKDDKAWTHLSLLKLSEVSTMLRSRWHYIKHLCCVTVIRWAEGSTALN